jgi:hypothetical protein
MRRSKQALLLLLPPLWKKTHQCQNLQLLTQKQPKLPRL